MSDACADAGESTLVHSTVSTTVPARLAASASSLSGVLVSSLTARADSSTAVRLTWQLVQSKRHDVEGFQVKYRALRGAATGEDVVDYRVKTVRPGDVTQFILTGRWFYYARQQNASRVLAMAWASVSLSVCHTAVLYQNGAR